MIKPGKRIFTLCTVIGLLGLTGTFSSAVKAEPIYKSIDAQGNVTYSSEPVKDADTVENVDIPPGPSEAAQEAGRERARQMESSASEIGSANAKRAQQRDVQEQTKEVEAVESYNRVHDDYRDPYRRARAREAIKNAPGRPTNPIARPPAGRPGGAPGGGRGR